MTVRAVHSCSAAAEAFPQVPFPDAVAELLGRDVYTRCSTEVLNTETCWYEMLVCEFSKADTRRRRP